jgi:protein gp37
MSAETGIEWTDRTWNPIRGCSRVSEGCRNCYAERVAFRFSGPSLFGDGKPAPYAGLVERRNGRPAWTGAIRVVEDAILEPLSWRKPARVFVNSMSDLFHEGVSDETLDRIFAVMALAPRHTFQVLTKRPARARAYLEARSRSATVWKGAARALGYALEFDGVSLVPFPLPNVWIGTSVEDQATADARIPVLLETPAAVRFVSAEPLLGPVDLDRGGWSLLEPMKSPTGKRRPGLDWVIVGGESGPGARPCDVRWVSAIVGDCQAAGVPVFVKQLGAKPIGPERAYFPVTDRKGGDPAEWPEGLRVRQFPAVARG